MSLVGGTLYVALNGVRIPVYGNWEVGFGLPKRDGFAGMDGEVHHTEKPQVPYIAGEAVAKPDLDLPAILRAEGATITAELANGKTPVLRGAYQAAEGVLGSEEGRIPLRFEGDSLEYT